MNEREVSKPQKTPFQKVTDDLTGGCGCACHTGTGYRTSCEHCSEPPKSVQRMVGFYEERIRELEGQHERLHEALVQARYAFSHDNPGAAEKFVRGALDA